MFGVQCDCMNDRGRCGRKARALQERLSLPFPRPELEAERRGQSVQAVAARRAAGGCGLPRGRRACDVCTTSVSVARPVCAPFSRVAVLGAALPFAETLLHHLISNGPQG